MGSWKELLEGTPKSKHENNEEISDKYAM